MTLRLAEVTRRVCSLIWNEKVFLWKGRVEPSGRLAAKGNNTLLAKDRSLRSEGLITSLSLMFLSHALSLSMYRSQSLRILPTYIPCILSLSLSLSLTHCLFSILCAILSPLCIVVSLFSTYVQCIFLSLFSLIVFDYYLLCFIVSLFLIVIVLFSSFCRSHSISYLYVLFSLSIKSFSLILHVSF